MTATPEAPASDKAPLTEEQARKSLKGLAAVAYDDLKGKIVEYNGLASQVEAVDGDPQALLENLRETSTDEKVVALNAKIEQAKDAQWKLEQQRDEILKAEVAKIKADAEAGVAEIREKADNLLAEIKPGLTYFRRVVSDEVFAFLPALHRAKGKGGNKGGGATGNRRVRGYKVTVDGKSYGSASEAAKALKVENEVLQSAFFAKVGDERPSAVSVTLTIEGNAVEVAFSKSEK